jgi:hypothetical protein
MRLAIAVLLGLLATACGPLEPGEPFPGWRAPLASAVPAPLACYRTLGVVDCHEAPLVGEESRRVGWFDPPVVPRSGG